MRTSKLATDTDTNIRYVNSKNLAPGVIARGKFSGKSEREATGPTGKFTSTTFFIEEADGKVGISKLGNLGYLFDRKLEVREGEVVEIEYNGRDKNNYHSFDITVLEELD